MAIMESDDQSNDGIALRLCKEYLGYFPVPDPDSMEIWVPSIGDEKELWESFCKMDWDYKLRVLKEAGAKDIRGVQRVPLKQLVLRNAEKAIEIEGRVVSVSENAPYKEFSTYECESCGWQAKVGNGSTRRPRHTKDQCASMQDIGADEKPLRPHIIELPDDPSDLVDSQIIKVQEMETDGKHPPVLLACIVKGEEMIWRARIGARIRQRGLLRHIKHNSREGQAFYRKQFDTFAIEQVDQDVELTKEDIDYIKSEMAKPGFYQKVVRSIAPYIWGMDPAKECVALVLASVGMKRPLKVLWVGDPGTGKSELMDYASAIAPGGFYITMANARYTGLTTTSEQDKETGRWMVTPGLFAYARFTAIDELQVTREPDVKNLNDVVESGKIRYALAGGNFGEMEANPAMLMSCNPHTGRVTDTNIQELLAFLGKGVPAFVSRMSLVYFFKDIVDEERDDKIADAVLKNSGDDPRAKYKEDWRQIKPELLSASTAITTIAPVGSKKIPADHWEYYFGENTLAKIFRYVSTLPIQELPENYHEQVKAHYKKNRKDSTSSLNKLLTPRYLRDAIKMAQARARLQGLTKPTQQDIDASLKLQGDSMETAAFDPKMQEIDANLINGSRGKRALARESMDSQFWQAVEDASRSEDGCTVDSLVYYLTTQQGEGKNWATGTVKKYVDSAIKTNRLIERANGALEKVDSRL